MLQGLSGVWLFLLPCHGFLRSILVLTGANKHQPYQKYANNRDVRQHKHSSVRFPFSNIASFVYVVNLKPDSQQPLADFE